MRESRQFTFDEVHRLLMNKVYETSGLQGEHEYLNAGMSIVGQQDDYKSIVFTVSWSEVKKKASEAR